MTCSNDNGSSLLVGSSPFTKDDVGRMLFLEPRPWYIRLWHFVWFRVLRRKRPTYGTYVISDIIDKGTVIVLDRTKGLSDGVEFREL